LDGLLLLLSPVGFDVEVGAGWLVGAGVLGVAVAVVLVCSSVVCTAPPELLMTTVGESPPPSVSVWVVEPVVVLTVVVELGREGDSDAEGDGVAVGDGDAVAPPSVVSMVAGDVSDCVGVANDTPGRATAVPIPIATAKAPVRPMYLAHRIRLLAGAGVLTPSAACAVEGDPFAALTS
jgi:hypothetical protein